MAAVLRQEGHIVSIFDRFSIQAVVGRNKDKINAAMLEHIKIYKPDLIGLNTISPLIYDTLECVSLIRRIYAGPVVAGGHHVSALPELTLLKIPGLNGIVQGEGESAINSLARGENPASIPGVWWKNKESIIVHTPAQQIDNLDTLPLPALDLLDMPFYTRPTMNTIRGHYLSTVSLLTSRGCNYRCDYCAESLTYGRGVRFHSPGYVIEWIKQVRKDYRVNGIYFHDNDFLIYENRSREICERIISAGLSGKIKWAIQTRVNRLKPDMIKLLKRAGCILVEVGVEAASQRELDLVNKQTTVYANEQAIALCRNEGISIHAYMLTALEGEIIEDLEQRIQWVKRVKPSTFDWHPLKIHPGTLLYQKKGDGFFEASEWTEENIVNYYKKDTLSCISQEKRREWMKRHYIRYHKRHHRLHILKVNAPIKLLQIFVKKIRASTLNLLGKISAVLANLFNKSLTKP
jgi:radical SAM superfamily enzyme YgiQ (UPF0313 family)